jgi:hypothetical protein
LTSQRPGLVVRLAAYIQRMEVSRSASSGRRVRGPAGARPRRALALGAALASIALSGCGQAATSGDVESSRTAALPIVTSTAQAAAAPKRAPAKRHNRDGPNRSWLAYSTASAQSVQTQPAAGSCHALGSGRLSRPDPRCTPGALNPAVTQATIGHTICQSGWTSTVRPPERVTETEKAASMAAYADSGPMSAYEYDHFVPLELGGAVNDARNLWPEPGASPNPKDAVEDELRQKVCDGQMTLAQAQHAIATNWTSLAAPTSANPPSPATTKPSTGTGLCTLSASYSDRYHDYDVYVHSNQPEQTVTITESANRAATWHTDASGYADVYFRAPANAAGETVTARVGGATCRGAL